MMRLTALIALVVTLMVPRLVLAEPTIILGVDHPPQPMPIAIPDLYAANPGDAQVGSDVARVVAADLERSGLFAPIDQKAFIQDNASLQQNIRFQDWKLINAQALVVGSAKALPGGQVNVQFRLWDVFGGQYMGGSQ